MDFKDFIGISKEEFLDHIDQENKDYWDGRVAYLEGLLEHQRSINEGRGIDPILKTFTEVMKVAVGLEQYRTASCECEEGVTRLCKIRIRLSREEIKLLFGYDTYRLYGAGLYIPIEGAMLSSAARNRSGFDSKRRYLDFSFLGEDFEKEHVVHLSTPTMNNGLFVPKRTRMTTDWVTRPYQIQYFNIVD